MVDVGLNLYSNTIFMNNIHMYNNILLNRAERQDAQMDGPNIMDALLEIQKYLYVGQVNG